MNAAFHSGRIFLFGAICLLCAVTTASAFALVDVAWEGKVRKAIFLISDTDFEEGLDILDAYIKAHPKTPEGYFLYAVGVQEKIQKFNDLTELPRFYSYANKCKLLAKKAIRKNKKDPVARFTLGAIHGYIGLLEAKQRNLISSFLSVRSAAKTLEALTEDRHDLPDAYIALGMVYYFASRKSAEEGGMVAWIIKNFITHGKDMKDAGVNMIRKSIVDEAYAKDYALSSLMWMRLYDHHYAEAKLLAIGLSADYTRDNTSRWVLGRVALVNRECADASKWFTEIENLNFAQGLDNGKFEDVATGKKMARLCAMVKKKDIAPARKLNEEITEWLNDDPKFNIEYQDEKNLIAFWKMESHKTDKLLLVLKKGKR